MIATTPWAIVLVGVVVGLFVGMIGTSGAIMIPVLILVFGLTQLRAQGTALFIAMLPLWIFPVIPYARAGNVNWKLGLTLAVGLAVGSYFGAKFAQQLPVGLIRKTFAIVLAGVSIRIFLQR